MTALAGKKTLITGGASGIGEATTRLFIDAGAEVFIVDHDAQRMGSLKAELNSPRLHSCTADLRQNDDIRRYSEQALASLGDIDVAIFNAGICGANTSLEDYPESLFDELLQINMKAVWLGMRAVVPGMKARQRGSIILTSSIQGLSALPGTTAYTTAKHALVGMMKGAALELAPYNVRVNTVHPGYVATPMMDTIHRMVNPDAPNDFQAAIASSVPMKRYAKPEEIAALIRHLASDEASYSTGGTFTADGGLLAALPG